MRLLDLFACQGGAGKGYADAGFEVVGVDTEDHSERYPYEFHQGDALEFLAERGHEFDAIHASPPCQGYLNLGAVNRKLGRTYEHPDLIAATRTLLQEIAPIYVIENVADAKPQLRNPVRICGTGLGMPLRRHRLFESNVPLTGVACDHGAFTEKKYWTGWRPNGETRLSTVVQIYGNAGGREHWPAALGVDWMDARGMVECVPPAYTEHIGRQLAAAIRPCTLILHCTYGTCPSCDREVMAPEWNKPSAPGCYWCGHEGVIACASRCGCVKPLERAA